MRIGEFCAKPCANDADCRASEGYVCDPQYGACVSPRQTSSPLSPTPMLAHCGAPALRRRAFGPVSQLSTDASPGIYQFEPSAAVTAHGDLVVLYTPGSPMGDMHPLAGAIVHADGRVDRDRPFASNRSNHYDPWLAASRDGTVFAAWLGFDSAGWPEQRAIIGFSRTSDGVAWSAPIVADDATADCPNETPGCLDKPVVLPGPDRADPRLEVVYVFYLNEPDRGTRVVSSRDGGKTYGKSTSVAADDGIYNAAVSDAGVVHVVYRAGSPDRVEYVQSVDGARTFSPPRVVSAPGEGLSADSFANPQVAVDERRGVLYVVYPAGGPDGRWDITLATSTDGGATWNRVKVNDDPPCANHMLPMAVLDSASGRLHLIWLENRSGAGGVAYTSCTRARSGPTATCLANEAVNDAPFAAYVLTRFSPKWMGEYGSLVLDAKRRVLHAVWTQPVPAPAGPTGRIFHAAAKL